MEINVDQIKINDELAVFYNDIFRIAREYPFLGRNSFSIAIGLLYSVLLKEGNSMTLEEFANKLAYLKKWGVISIINKTEEDSDILNMSVQFPLSNGNPIIH